MEGLNSQAVMFGTKKMLLFWYVFGSESRMRLTFY